MAKNDLKSFTAASTLPAKLLQNTVLIDRIKGGFIPPVHVQLNPTNRCNLKCSFCSCSERDKQQELSLEIIVKTMTKFKELGCESVTITGGGEPLMHPDINFLVPIINRGLGIKVGLVTNGTQFRKFNAYQDLVWCRISVSDDRELPWQELDYAHGAGFGVDWAFSYVMTCTPNWPNLFRVVAVANEYDFTHVRIVGDLLDIDHASLRVIEARQRLAKEGIDDSKVIYQDRAEYVRGRKCCGISLLKPVLGADGAIYPCCGVQYAQEPPGRDLVEAMKMGHWQEIARIWQEQRAFNGSVCARCYYDPYNSALDLFTTPLCHQEFV